MSDGSYLIKTSTYAKPRHRSVVFYPRSLSVADERVIQCPARMNPTPLVWTDGWAYVGDFDAGVHTARRAPAVGRVDAAGGVGRLERFPALQDGTQRWVCLFLPTLFCDDKGGLPSTSTAIRLHVYHTYITFSTEVMSRNA